VFPERPAIPLRQPVIGDRAMGRAGRGTFEGPGPQRQAERLAPAFQRLSDAFEAERLRIAERPEALEPEQILVAEIVGELPNFVDAIRRIDGFEWLAEHIDEDRYMDEEFAVIDKDGKRKPAPRQLFILASDQQAWRELLSLWRRFKEGRPFERGTAPFRHLFDHLRDLREWGDADRLTRAGAAEAWARDLAGLGDVLIPFEAELWFREDGARRAAARDTLAAELAAVGGRVIQELVLEEISYHGLLGEAPARLLVEAANLSDVQWLSTEGVRLFHPAGQTVAPTTEDRELAEAVAVEDALPERTSRVALLDGLPIENHALLAGRLVVDDPEGWAATTPAAERVHGTAMASLAIHGDLSARHQPPRERLYLRPILRFEAPAWVANRREEMPADRLVVDTVYTAVARMFEGEDPAAPGVRVIGLSVGDQSQQFDRFISPWARLLDWLSFKYRVLFLVSAGNHLTPIGIPRDIDLTDGEELQHEVLDFVRRNALSRRLLAPAESINALTVGAAHADASDVVADHGRVEPITSGDLPAVFSPTATGFRRAVKPEILLPGGRQLVRPLPDDDGGLRRLELLSSRQAPGLRVAAPDQAGALDRTAFLCGTSGANALAVGSALLLLEQLDELRERWGPLFPTAPFDAVLVKALLAHTARWGVAREAVAAVLADAGESASRAAVAPFLGYGRAAPEQALSIPTGNRITALYASEIGAGEAHTYMLPLPPALAGTTHERRLTLTLAWLTPTNPRHRHYRRAALKLEPGDEAGVFGDRQDAEPNAARRGTLQHETLQGASAVPYLDGASATFVVSCREEAGSLEDSVPYAIVLTLEAPVEAEVPIYTQVSERIAVRVGVRPGG
jgi:hypothetical protein